MFIGAYWKNIMFRKNEFVLIWISILFLLLLIAAPGASFASILGPLRLILGLTIIAFIPGYVLLAVILPRATQISFLQRISISFALSIAVLPIMALFLDRLPWGITLWPMVIFLIGFTLIMTFVALIRRRRLPVDERVLVPSFDLRQWWQGRSVIHRIAFGCMLGVDLLGIAAFALIAHYSSTNPAMTEFYLLSPENIADLYPSMSTGSVTVRLGIVNREKTNETYTILVLVDGQQFLKTDPILVAQGQSWEDNLAVSIPTTGTSHLVDYELLRGADPTPYHTLRLNLHSP
jgi:uncharacterized membrane protein